MPLTKREQAKHRTSVLAHLDNMEARLNQADADLTAATLAAQQLYIAEKNANDGAGVRPERLADTEEGLTVLDRMANQLRQLKDEMLTAEFKFEVEEMR